MGGSSPVERVQFVRSKEDACGYSSKFTKVRLITFIDVLLTMRQRGTKVLTLSCNRYTKAIS